MSAYEPSLGIDFGTSKTSMAWYNPATHRAEILTNAEGEEHTPSVVYFGDTEVLVGKPAENRLTDMTAEQAAEGRIVRSVKRDLLAPPTVIGGRLVDPVEVVTHVLAKMRRDAEQLHFRRAVERAVITHPAAFSLDRQDKIREAALRAGFRAVELVAEPVAAAGAFVRSGQLVGAHVLVYDLGAGTFDLARVARGADGTFRLTHDPVGLPRCGGDDFDRALYDHCDDLARRDLGRGLSLDDRRVDPLSLLLCRERKENLSQQPRQTFSNMLKGADGHLIRFRHTVTREVFEDLVHPYAAKTVELVRQELEGAARDERPVDTVVLVGGSTRVPLVQRMLKEVLQKVGPGVELRMWDQQDAAVALGAAYAAHERWGSAAPRTGEPARAPEKLPPAPRAPSEPARLVPANSNPMPRGKLGRGLVLALGVLFSAAALFAAIKHPGYVPPPPPPPPPPGVLTGGVWRAHIPAGALAGQSIYDFRPDGSVWDTHYDLNSQFVGRGGGWYTRTGDGVEIRWSSGYVERGRMIWRTADVFRYEIVAHSDVRQIGFAADYHRSPN